MYGLGVRVLAIYMYIYNYDYKVLGWGCGALGLWFSTWLPCLSRSTSSEGCQGLAIDDSRCNRGKQVDLLSQTIF